MRLGVASVSGRDVPERGRGHFKADRRTAQQHGSSLSVSQPPSQSRAVPETLNPTAWRKPKNRQKCNRWSEEPQRSGHLVTSQRSTSLTSLWGRGCAQPYGAASRANARRSQPQCAGPPSRVSPVGTWHVTRPRSRLCCPVWRFRRLPICVAVGPLTCVLTPGGAELVGADAPAYWERSPCGDVPPGQEDRRPSGTTSAMPAEPAHPLTPVASRDPVSLCGGTFALTVSSPQHGPALLYPQAPSAHRPPPAAVPRGSSPPRLTALRGSRR